MRFTYIDVNFDVTYQGRQNWSKILSMDILRVFGEHHMSRQNWCLYMWTSLCQFFFVSTSSTVQVFDNLTFDIFSQLKHWFHLLEPWGYLEIYNNSIETEYFTFFRTSSLSKSEIFSQIYKNSIETEYFTSFRTSTPSQSEIFFQDQHTLPKWNILSRPPQPAKKWPIF